MTINRLECPLWEICKMTSSNDFITVKKGRKADYIQTCEFCGSQSSKDKELQCECQTKIRKFGSRCCASCKNNYNIATTTLSDFYESIPKRMNAWGFYSSKEVSRAQRYMYENYWNHVTSEMPPPCRSCSEVYKKEYRTQLVAFTEKKDEYLDMIEEMRDLDYYS